MMVSTEELAKIYKVSTWRILRLYHSGVITAEAKIGKDLRFDSLKVAKILKQAAHKDKAEIAKFKESIRNDR